MLWILIFFLIFFISNLSMLAVSKATTDLLPFTFSSRNLFDFLLGASLWSRITFGVDILISPENCIRIKFTFFDGVGYPCWGRISSRAGFWWRRNFKKIFKLCRERWNGWHSSYSRFIDVVDDIRYENLLYFDLYGFFMGEIYAKQFVSFPKQSEN